MNPLFFMKTQILSTYLHIHCAEEATSHLAIVEINQEGESGYFAAKGASEMEAFFNALEKIGIDWKNDIPGSVRLNQGSPSDAICRITKYLNAQP